MARTTHYVPAISKPLIAALYHESKRRKLPMTRLVDEILTRSLASTPGWETASKRWPELEVATHDKDGVGAPR